MLNRKSGNRQLEHYYDMVKFISISPMKITLQLPNKSHQKDYEAMIKEFFEHGEQIIPQAMIMKSEETFDDFLIRCENYRQGINMNPEHVPATLFFMIDETGKVVGAVAIRHELNERLKLNGGHIGYGVRPSERKKGYASITLKLALEKCKELGIENALIVCKKDNIGSKKVIQKNGGARDSDYEFEGSTKERYRIKL
ncbi:MAG: GNAT family N-acetyltransferase [candidate division SR1 bacterium CG_4_9_14_3_um_filter_40_9]|nr:MAG: GNAT family N-acetyltransferase [candidate division SR1 bacterium CG_4_9_14_3_um_filter_40_9]